MGVVTWVISQTVITGVALAALRRNGVITIEPSRIRNDTARLVFVSTLQLSENVVEIGERVWNDLAKGLGGSK